MSDYFGDPGFLDRFGGVDAPVEWVGHVDRLAVEQAGQLRVEAGRAVLAAPELVVVSVGPARGMVPFTRQILPSTSSMASSAVGRTPPVRPSRSGSACRRSEIPWAARHRADRRETPGCCCAEYTYRRSPQPHTIPTISAGQPSYSTAPEKRQHPHDEFPHLRRHQPCSRMVGQRFSWRREFFGRNSRILSREPLPFITTRRVGDQLFRRVLNRVHGSRTAKSLPIHRSSSITGARASMLNSEIVM